MKKVWKYLIITVLLLIGLCAVGALYLFFVPNSSLFNISYISNNDTISSDRYGMEYKTIKLNSNRYDVRVMASSGEEIYAEVHNNVFGFVTTNSKNVSIKPTLSNDMLTLDIVEPVGAIVTQNSFINLVIPKTHLVNLILKNDNSYTSINSQVNIIDFEYKTNSGDLDLSKGSISGDIKLDLNKADCEISDSFTTTNNDVDVSIYSGKFESKNTLGVVNIQYDKRGVISLKECSDVIMEEKSAGGRIEVEKVTNKLQVVSSETNVYVDIVEKGAFVTLTGSGDVRIDNLSKESMISTTNGNIEINTANDNVLVTSTNGNIKVNNAYKKVTANTTNGSMNINFAVSANHYAGESAEYRALSSNIEGNGKLNATNVENVNILAKKGSVNVNMLDVLGNNIINVESTSVYVVVDSEAKYLLSTYSETGSVRVNLTEIAEYGGYTDRDEPPMYVNCTVSTNILDIDTISGSLTVLDTNLV